jgi:hypothetical protein
VVTEPSERRRQFSVRASISFIPGEFEPSVDAILVGHSVSVQVLAETWMPSSASLKTSGST